MKENHKRAKKNLIGTNAFKIHKYESEREKLSGQLSSATFLQAFEIFRTFLPQTLHGDKLGKFQNL